MHVLLLNLDSPEQVSILPQNLSIELIADQEKQ